MSEHDTTNEEQSKIIRSFTGFTRGVGGVIRDICNIFDYDPLLEDNQLGNRALIIGGLGTIFFLKGNDVNPKINKLCRDFGISMKSQKGAHIKCFYDDENGKRIYFTLEESMGLRTFEGVLKDLGVPKDDWKIYYN